MTRNSTLSKMHQQQWDEVRGMAPSPISRTVRGMAPSPISRTPGSASSLEEDLLALRLKHAALSPPSVLRAERLWRTSPIAGNKYKTTPRGVAKQQGGPRYTEQRGAADSVSSESCRSTAEPHPPAHTPPATEQDIAQHDFLADVVKRPFLAHLQDRDGATLLHLAARLKSEPEIVDALLRLNPAAAQVRSHFDGSLPLHLAAAWGAPMGAVSLLIESFTDALNIADRSGAVPVDLANKFGHKTLVTILVNRAEASKIHRSNSMVSANTPTSIRAQTIAPAIDTSQTAQLALASPHNVAERAAFVFCRTKRVAQRELKLLGGLQQFQRDLCARIEKLENCIAQQPTAVQKDIELDTDRPRREKQKSAEALQKWRHFRTQNGSAQQAAVIAAMGRLQAKNMLHSFRKRPGAFIWGR